MLYDHKLSTPPVAWPAGRPQAPAVLASVRAQKCNQCVELLRGRITKITVTVLDVSKRQKKKRSTPVGVHGSPRVDHDVPLSLSSMREEQLTRASGYGGFTCAWSLGLFLPAFLLIL